jgi:hypothetical protein
VAPSSSSFRRMPRALARVFPFQELDGQAVIHPLRIGASGAALKPPFCNGAARHATASASSSQRPQTLSGPGQSFFPAPRIRLQVRRVRRFCEPLSATREAPAGPNQPTRPAVVVAAAGGPPFSSSWRSAGTRRSPLLTKRSVTNKPAARWTSHGDGWLHHFACRARCGHRRRPRACCIHMAA